MKMINKIAAAGFGLLLTGSTVFAQSLDDAKKAIDAEQYQKAKSMLKNLTVTQASKDENYFYLGWVYIKQDYLDSALTCFNKGIAINSKSALNFAGIGAVDHIQKDSTGAETNFKSAIDFASRHDADPYVYVGKAYLLPVEGSVAGPNGTPVSASDAKKAIAVLTKGEEADKHNVDLFITLGDAYRSQLNSNDAYTAYSNALSLDSKSAAANVAEGVLWKYADNFDGAQQQFQKALAADPNYGPAYREWAEMDLRWANTDPSQYQAKVKEAADNYKKYISLTDYSPESQLRYADFLVDAKDYTTLEKVAQDIIKNSPKPNLRVYRYLGYSAFENKDYQTGLTALTKWVTQADPKRLIPSDYLYMGKLELALKNDSLGVTYLRKALAMDTTQVDLYGEIATDLYHTGKYKEAGDAYKIYGEKSPKATLLDHFHEGYSYYLAFLNQYSAHQKDTVNTPKPDTTLLANADSAMTYVERKLSKPNAQIMFYHADIKNFEDGDRNNIKGYAKPLYEQYVQLLTSTGDTTKADYRTNLAIAYAYLGNYALYKDKDQAKALDYFTKAKDMDPNNAQVVYYFATESSKKKGAK